MGIKECIFNIFFPTKCVSCSRLYRNDSTFEHICDKCFDAIELQSALMCPICGGRIPSLPSPCHASPYMLAPATRFETNAVQALIYGIKYNSLHRAALPLGALLGKYFQKILPIVEEIVREAIIIPLPLHSTRLRTRGYNQTALLAHSFRSTLSNQLQIHEAALIKTRNTHSQTKCKNYEERAKNIEGSFSISTPESIKGKNIILIDDVSTSGATLREAAVALKRAGAKKILALVVAKA